MRFVVQKDYFGGGQFGYSEIEGREFIWESIGRGWVGVSVMMVIMEGEFEEDL